MVGKPRTLLGRLAFCSALLSWAVIGVVSVFRVSGTWDTIGTGVFHIAAGVAYTWGLVGLLLDRPKWWALGALLIIIPQAIWIFMSESNLAREGR